MTTKKSILLSTLELASNQGLGSVSLSQIAEKVGIKKSSLYNHFASKEEIVDGLYEYLRDNAKQKVTTGLIDYGEFVKGKSAIEVLTQCVKSYLSINSDVNMQQFYKFIMSERSLNSEAAKIMLYETKKMILATKQLFYALQVQNIMKFDNVDAVAISFTMTVHSFIDYIGDQKTAGLKPTAEKLLDEYIADFCDKYKSNVQENEKSNL